MLDHSPSIQNARENYLGNLVDNQTTLRKFNIFGLQINNYSMREAVEWVVSTDNKGTKSAVFVNAHSVNLSRRHQQLRNHINLADRVFADGTGVRIAARKIGIELLDNVNGTDMLPLLCKYAEKKHLSIYFLGSKPGVAKKAVEKLRLSHPNLKVAGHHHGHFGHDGPQNTDVLKKINASNADILLVGMGSPIQEEWIANNKEHLNVSTALAVGGLFDFYSGLIPRAPLWIRRQGMEWAWRLLQEPKAKFTRYVVGNPLFFYHLLLLKNDTHQNTGKRVYSNSGISMPLQRFSAALALALSAPVLLLIGTYISLTSRGPVFYCQTRVGQHGQLFKLFKLRSMYIPGDPKYVQPNARNSNRSGLCKKFIDDPRVTPIGKFIRRYSIDEVPQLWNVLRGDMALVGPRPAMVEEVEKYNHRMVRRFDAPPGLTGLWQVSGRADTTFEEQIFLDLRYVNQRGWINDIKILLKTIPAVLQARGAY